jgi:hypothetical protein
LTDLSTFWLILVGLAFIITINYTQIMNYFFLLLMAISISSISFCQEESLINNDFRNEIGIDATMFVKQYLNFASSEYYIYSPSTYLLSYKRIHNKHALRFAFNCYYEVKKDTGGYSSNTGNTDKNRYFDARLGYEFRNHIGKRWMYYYGFDLSAGYTHRVQHNMGTSYGTPDWIHNIKRIGGGPILGFQFYFNNRLSVSTEASLYILYSKDNVDFKYEDFPEQNTKELHEFTQVLFSPPIYVSFNLAL